MSLTSDPSRIPYELHPPEFEQGVVRLCVVSPSFWERAGRFFDPERLGKLEAKEVVRAVGEIIRDTGKHPGQVGGVPLVVQRIQRKSTEAGRLTRPQVAACYEYLCTAPADLGEDQAVAEVAPILKRALRQQLSKHASNAVAPGNEEQSEGEVRKALAAIDAVGRSRQSSRDVGISADSILSAVATMRLPRVRFGIPELDAIMGGGPQKGTAGFVAAFSGHGKSTLLNHWACQTIRDRGFAIYLTGEPGMGKDRQRLRILSNVTGVPLKAMEHDDAFVEEATLRWKWLQDHKQLGRIVVEEFVATVTTANDLFDFVEDQERIAGVRADLVVIDADEHVNIKKLDFPGLDELVKRANDPNTYEGFGRFYAFLGYHAKGGQKNAGDRPDLARACGSASQVRGVPNPARFKILVGEDAADSIRKVRIVDWVVSANYHYTQQGTIFHAAKGRHEDIANPSTPALPRNFACAQMIEIKNDPYPWVGNPREWRKKQYTFWKGI